MSGRALLITVVVLSTALVLACPGVSAATTRTGTLEEQVIDDFATGSSSATYDLRSGDSTTPILPTRLSAAPGELARVSGSVEDGHLVGAVEGVGAGQEPTEAETPAEMGPRKVAAVLVKFADDPEQPWPASETRSKLFTAADSANAFFKEESYGQISLTGKSNPDGDVFGWFTVDTPTDGCPDSTWEALARQEAEEAGIDLSGYDHVIFIFTYHGSCGWSGIASVGGSQVHINGNAPVGTLTHELGHNLGLRHAGSWSCISRGAPVQIGDTCTVDQYGDPFDTMGGNIAARHNSAWNLSRLGILVPQNIETIRAGGTYTLESAFDPTLEPTALRIPRTREAGGVVTSWYYLEIRKTGGVFENVTDATTTGVSIRATASGSSPETLLVDCNPATPDFNDAPLAVGESFVDGSALRVKTLSAGAGKATVLVQFSGEADWTPPSTPSGLTAGFIRSGVQLAWAASSDDVGVDHYLVLRDGAEIAQLSGTDFLDSTASVGPHAYAVVAVDAAGNVSAASAGKVATVADTRPPSIPTGLTAGVTRSGVQLAWAASSDDVGVDHYLVLRDGAAVGQVSGTDFLDSTASIGRYAYTVVAVDAAGNISPVAAPVEVTLSPTVVSQTQAGAVRLSSPLVRWRQVRRDAIAIEVDARADADVIRVGAWLDGRLIRTKGGRLLRFVLTPQRMGCEGALRLVARAYGREGERSTASGSIRPSHIHGRPAGCRHHVFFPAG